MFRANRLALAIAIASAFGMNAAAHAAGPKAEVIHWWTSGGEAAAIKAVADAYRHAGGAWVDSAVAGSEQARAVAINRIVGGNSPAAAQFNTSKQFLDVIDEGMLSNVDTIARQQGWDKSLPQPIIDVIKVKGHYYAVPVNIHMPAWIWYSKAAFKQAGIAKEPATMDELFAALDKLKARDGRLAHGGQSWQETSYSWQSVGQRRPGILLPAVFRDRDPRAIESAAFKNCAAVLQASCRRMSTLVPPGRNWKHATAMLTPQGRRADHRRLGKGDSMRQAEAPKGISAASGFGQTPLAWSGRRLSVFPGPASETLNGASDLGRRAGRAGGPAVNSDKAKGSIRLARMPTRRSWISAAGRPCQS
ncbi:ABC transporter substrate-binding protein [Massilia cavernae]|uniref:ABC transporter substrate-binding protein n=1 Tax=Massilia cavernae TaxID=2320864 RepID=UPI001E52AB86|nr:extracellular solute-binding protein [Massilia cavernae]